MTNRTISTALAAAIAIPAAFGIAACASSSSAPPAAAASPAATAAAMPPPPPAPAVGPLTIAHFASTSGGDAARGICEQWVILRHEYANRLATDSPYQLNQWFSSADWHKARSDGNALGDDPAYSHLEVALGEAMVGDMADAGTIRLMDDACARGD
jgi:hypothetical protein